MHLAAAADKILPVLKTMSPEQVRRALAEAEASPLAASDVVYPGWYLHRWHFLPEGYLSRRGVAGYETLIRRLYYNLREREVLERVARELRGAHAIAELGCGTGRALALLRQRLPDATLKGIDLSPFMLERARTRLPLEVELRHANSDSLPWSEESVDAVVALHHLGHMPGRDAAKSVAEASRVLRPGGQLLLVEHRWHRLPAMPLRTIRRVAIAGGAMCLTLARKESSMTTDGATAYA